ncbi:hypothetical protein F2P81_001705 [Scophthalmus maximus]|uniref:Uncharacterized protein n=1 Tax=Scophthalmus maximus TaxID=52904 RepID=A0A6A4TC36_SCOMX|nr:hypothetical protein F2P81_001705 [Scophthalmus maximus]
MRLVTMDTTHNKNARAPLTKTASRGWIGPRKPPATNRGHTSCELRRIKQKKKKEGRFSSEGIFEPCPSVLDSPKSSTGTDPPSLLCKRSHCRRCRFERDLLNTDEW